MKSTIDTNILVRMLTRDHPQETPVAEAFFRQNEVVITNQTLCEMCWVLRRVYRFTTVELQQAITALRDAQTVTVDRDAVSLGLSFLEAGGDFPDAIILYEGAKMGAGSYATFDRKAVARAEQHGLPARLLVARG
ncbi:type II toxin-antitoxin system VapC family toxin [Rhizobium sp. DKSPLA3]|uniref:Type II toxin-antitoxin system VapC family toxin n=1 Tax=Rhizobium quercicola TaxID=2901226 RepID=A0A9X1T972_9HYPH|nr:type II toxin-antitoxin system VapC family toxin [Rhizobium quercicola]